MHCSFGPLQSVHACPLMPHAYGSIPRLHVLPWQHPVQFDGPHACGAHTPPAKHTPPAAAQSMHARP
jgi:hypothetical protein